MNVCHSERVCIVIMDMLFDDSPDGSACIEVDPCVTVVNIVLVLFEVINYFRIASYSRRGYGVYRRSFVRRGA